MYSTKGVLMTPEGQLLPHGLTTLDALKRKVPPEHLHDEEQHVLLRMNLLEEEVGDWKWEREAEALYGANSGRKSFPTHRAG